MRIHFIGYLKTPYTRQDLELLSCDNIITVFDLSSAASSFRQIPKFLLDSFCEWKKVCSSDVVWIYYADYPALPFIFWAKLFGKSVVVNIAGWEVCAGRSTGYGNQLKPVRGAVTRWILRHVDRCIVPSEAYKRITAALVPTANIVVVPGFIDTSLCDEPLPEKHGIVTAVCNYKHSLMIKGIPTFEAATQGMDARVIRNAPHDRLMEELKTAKVYCQLSYTESFGMSLLEAMACGCVPVVTDKGALPEVVGDTGLIVPYQSPEKTRIAVQKALVMDGTLARNRAREFSRERKQTSIEKLLEGLLTS